MPKETFILKSFDKGLVTQTDARDLENDAVYLSDGFSYSHSGTIKLLGDGWTQLSIDAVNDILSNSEEKQKLLTFRYDYNLGADIEDYDADASEGGYGAPPEFIEGGVTYYVVPSDVKVITPHFNNGSITNAIANGISLIAHYIQDGVDTFQTFDGNNGILNSAVYSTSGSPSNYGSDNPLYHEDRNIEQPLTVGPDSNAEIVGYFVDGGFRYCDANFENKRNNIVGYVGHVNKRYLTELDKVRIPAGAGTDNYINMSFSRNHWHASSYTHHCVFPGGSFGGISGDELENLSFKSKGMRNWTQGFWPAPYDGYTQLRHIKTFVAADTYQDDETTEDVDESAEIKGQELYNYKMWGGMVPNLDQEDSAGYPVVSTTNALGGVTGSGFTHRGSMDSGHELRRSWYMGVSTLYDGDPQGVCQETGISNMRSYIDTDTGERTQKDYFRCIFDFQEANGTVGDVAPYTALENINDGETGDGTNTGYHYGDFDVFPKIFFSWTFLPWWAENQTLCPIDDVGNVPTRISYARGLWDARITGFRIYIKDVGDTEDTWYNVATIDALRGVVSYDGCSVQQHPWVMRGRMRDNPDSDSSAHGEGAGGFFQPKILEPGRADEGEFLSNFAPVWSNPTTGRCNFTTQNRPTNSNIHTRDFWHMFDDERSNSILAQDPLGKSNCLTSVNLEAIPDLTYDLINGYKPQYSPTQTDIFEETFSPSNWSSTNYTHITGDIKRKFGDIHRFKTATVLNDKVYIGNLYNTSTGKTYPDRILKTEPGQYDIFPDDGFHHIDLASGDGDSIVHMENYSGKLFVWKRNALYVIAIDDEGNESIDATHLHHGIKNKHQVVITKHGPVWFNDGGVYLYDMEAKIHNLIVGRLDRGRTWDDYGLYAAWTLLELAEEIGSSLPELQENFLLNHLQGTLDIIGDLNNDDNIDVYDIMTYVSLWNAGAEHIDQHALVSDLYINQIQFGWKGFVGSDGFGNSPVPIIGYHETDDKIFIVKNSTDSGMNECSGDAYIFDFFTKNWSYGRKLFPSGTGAFKSNFINDAKGNLVYLYSQVGADEDVSHSLQAWNDMPGGENGGKNSVKFVTKDIDFESPGVRKKIYKVYFSVSGIEVPNVKVYYAINGSKRFKPVNTFTGVQNYDKENGFIPPYVGEFGDRWYTAILKPSSTGGAESLNNIYSIQLMVTGVNEMDILDTSGLEDDESFGVTPGGNDQVQPHRPIGDSTMGGGTSHKKRPIAINNKSQQTPTSTPSYGDEMYNPPLTEGDVTIQPDFQINDITIIYRAKNAR